MSRIFLLVITLFFSFSGSHPVLAQGSILVEKGTPADSVKSFADRIIPEDSEMYVPPNDTELDRMQHLISQVLISASTENAVSLSETSFEASRLGYELVKITNKKTGTIYYVLREGADQNKGWGLYIFRAGNNSSDMVIETPHPLYDLDTERIGILAFEKSGARAFLLAGAHRNANLDGSADVAHSPRSMFQTVHESVAATSTTVIQIHGFTLVKNPGYPQIVLSSIGADTSSVSQLSSILEARNFTTGIANGGNLKELEGINNIQGKYASTTGATFIHMELESSIRNYPSRYGKVVAAISEFGSRDEKKPEVNRFSIILGQDIWYYLIPALVMTGAFAMLLFERRNLKSGNK